MTETGKLLRQISERDEAINALQHELEKTETLVGELREANANLRDEIAWAPNCDKLFAVVRVKRHPDGGETEQFITVVEGDEWANWFRGFPVDRAFSVIPVHLDAFRLEPPEDYDD